jgi:FAD/FMN-containing dehydrogenase
MATAAVNAVTELIPSFSGRLLQPDDALFDEARRVHNGLVDKRPGVIARCLGAADVVDALGLAKKIGLEVAVRGGGHNVGGRGTIDGGLLIDLSLMKGLYVDPKARTARAEGGTLWKEFNRATQLHGLATTGGVISSTGIAGLTLGGGLGWLMAKYGMALDNLLSVELVLADGKVVRASSDEHPDLFWAVRGGGGNYGVATSLEFRLHPVGPMVMGGLVAHPVSAAKDLLSLYRDLTATASDDLTLFFALLTGPDGVTKLAAIVAGHIGPQDRADAELRPVKAFGKPAMDVIGPMPYSVLNSMLDASFPRGARNYWKSHFIDRLTDDAIDMCR